MIMLCRKKWRILKENIFLVGDQMRENLVKSDQSLPNFFPWRTKSERKECHGYKVTRQPVKLLVRHRAPNLIKLNKLSKAFC